MEFRETTRFLARTPVTSAMIERLFKYPMGIVRLRLLHITPPKKIVDFALSISLCRVRFGQQGA